MSQYLQLHNNMMMAGNFPMQWMFSPAAFQMGQMGNQFPQAMFMPQMAHSMPNAQVPSAPALMNAESSIQSEVNKWKSSARSSPSVDPMNANKRKRLTALEAGKSASRKPEDYMMKSNDPDRPAQCGICNATFHTKWTLKKHIRTHTGEKPYKCKKCHQGFTQRGSWYRHVFMSHGNEVEETLEHKVHKCPHCPKCFRRILNLKKHMEGHKDSPVTMTRDNLSLAGDLDSDSESVSSKDRRSSISSSTTSDSLSILTRVCQQEEVKLKLEQGPGYKTDHS